MMHAPVLSMTDSLAMTGRSFRGAIRQIDALIMSIMLPVMLMLMFVYVFGGSIDVGTDYADYVVPAVILLCAGVGAAGTAVAVASDMERGVIDRFRSLPISSSAVLVGHVVSSVLVNLVSTAMVIGVAFLTGFRPSAGIQEWLGVAGLLLLFMVSMSWLATALGLLMKNVEAANSVSFVVLFLPYLSSGFVRPDSMPKVLAAIARHQPYTPLIDSLRGLLLGTPVGSAWWQAVLWFGAILVIGMVSSVRLFMRQSR